MSFERKLFEGKKPAFPTAKRTTNHGQPAQVTVPEIIKFCFPAQLQHAHSTGRLFLLAEYGPLSRKHSYNSCLCDPCKTKATQHRRSDAFLFRFVHNQEQIDKSHLDSSIFHFLCKKCRAHISNELHISGGIKGRDILTAGVIRGMTDECIRMDILTAYDRHIGLTRQQQSHFLELVTQQRGDKIHPLWSKAVISEMFDDAAKDSDGNMDFYMVRELIQSKRTELVNSLRKMYPMVINPKPEPVTYKSSTLGTYLRKGRRKVTSAESYVLTSRLLHKYAQHLSKDSLKDKAAITVYFLRDLPPDSETHWKSY